MEQPLLQTNDLCKQYKGAGNYMAVYHMNLSIPRGKIIGLLGPNGCGKTTLIKMINGLLAPSCGSITINGYAPGVETKKIVSYLPERTYLQSNMRIREMVEYFQDFYTVLKSHHTEALQDFQLVLRFPFLFLCFHPLYQQEIEDGNIPYLNL